MRAHKIKTWPKFFRAVRDETKNFEVRKADRDYRVGDFLCLVEFDPDTDQLTGDYEYRRIEYILDASAPPRGLLDGFVVLGITTIDSINQERLAGTYHGALQQTVEWLKPVVSPAAA